MSSVRIMSPLLRFQSGPSFLRADHFSKRLNFTALTFKYLLRNDNNNDGDVTGALPAAEQAEVPPIQPWQPHQAHHPQPLRKRSQGQHHQDVNDVLEQTFLRLFRLRR